MVNPYEELLSSFSVAAYQPPQSIVNAVISSVTRPSTGMVQVIGYPFTGKSSLLDYLYREAETWSIDRLSGMQKVMPILIKFRGSQRLAQDVLYSEFRRQATAFIERNTTMKIDPKDVFKNDIIGVTNTHDFVEGLNQAVNRVVQFRIRPLILLDDFDLAFGQMSAIETGALRPLRERSAFVLALSKPLSEVNGRLLRESPFFNVSSHEYLRLLTRQETEQLINQTRRENADLTPVSSYPLSDLAWLHRQTGGHPFLVVSAASLLWTIRQNHDVLTSSDPLDETLKTILSERLRQISKSVFSLTWRGLKPEAQTLLRKLARRTSAEEESGSCLGKPLPPLSIRERDALEVLLDFRMIRRYLHAQAERFEIFSPIFTQFAREQREPSPLSRLEADVYKILAAAEGEYVSIERLCRSAWSSDYRSNPSAIDEIREKRIQPLISRLRGKLPQTEDIDNDRHMGYRLIKEYGRDS